MGEVAEFAADGEGYEQPQNDDHRRPEAGALRWTIHDEPPSRGGEPNCRIHPECATMVPGSAGWAEGEIGREGDMRFGAGILIGMLIGAVIIIWILVQILQAIF